jgi:hypothetical protein
MKTPLLPVSKIRSSMFAIAVAVVVGSLPADALAQASFTGSYSQDFDTLAQSGTANAQTGGIFSGGWSFLEASTNANTTYSGGTGSSTTGDTYSFGSAAVPGDRAFGMLQSGSLTSILGFQFTNNTGATLTQLMVGFRGETWRAQVAADTLQFSYQLGSVALNAAGYTVVAGLTYTSVTAVSAGAVDGNSNFTDLSALITGLSIAPGQTVTFRWVDSTAASSAGMGIDNFTLTAPAPTVPDDLPFIWAALALVGTLLAGQRLRLAVVTR